MLLTGRVVRLPEAREGIKLSQFVPSPCLGPTFQAGADGYMVQVTSETSKLVEDKFADRVIYPLLFLSPACGTLATSRYTDPVFWVLTCLFSNLYALGFFLFGLLASSCIMAFVWGEKVPATVSVRPRSDRFV